jgi:hypothetical protein
MLRIIRAKVSKYDSGHPKLPPLASVDCPFLGRLSGYIRFENHPRNIRNPAAVLTLADPTPGRFALLAYVK